MKVLLGIDHSKYADDVARAFISQFRPENTEVLVLHVLQPLGLIAPPEMAIGYAPELADMKQPAHELVERIADLLRNAKFKAETATEAGDVRECILDAAAEWHADLIVVGSHGQARHSALPAGQRGGVRRPPRQMLRPDHPHNGSRN